MARWRITHDRPDCIACGACAAVSENWTLDTEDGLADPVEAIVGDDAIDENREAAEVCPVFIIHINKVED